MNVDGPWRRVARGAGLLGANGAPAPTIFAEMTALALRTNAINLGQGFPDEDGPAAVLEAARQAITDGVNQYGPGLGNPLLREAVAAHQARFYGQSLDPEREVLVTAGATEALAATLLALVEPGDEVVTFEPFYDAYGALIAMAGGRHVTVPLRAPDFAPDLDELERAVTDRTKVILVNDPHNPTGATLAEAAKRRVVELAERHGAYIVTDEVYEHLRFETRHVPIATLPGASDRTISISSGGKTFSTTGWKIGWAMARPELIQAILAVKQFLTFVNGAPFQPAIAAGLALPDSFFDGVAATLRDKRDLLGAGLREAGFRVFDSRATYFLVTDVSPLGFSDAVEFCRLLPQLAGVVAIPLSAFYTTEHRNEGASLVRFAFCKRFEVLGEAVARLGSLVAA